MAKLNLPDGWYEVPGNGKYSDPRKRDISHTTEGAYFWVSIINGEPAYLCYSTINTESIEEFRKSHPSLKGAGSIDFRVKCEGFWGISVADLFKQQNETGSGIAKVAGFALGAAFLVGLVKQSAKHKKLKNEKLQNKIGKSL